MVLEVEAGAAARRGWEVVMSRSKNMPYYYNAKSQKVYWVDDELPRGWRTSLTTRAAGFYFHIKDKTGTTTYDKPANSKRPFDRITQSEDPEAAATSTNRLKRNATPIARRREDHVLDLACGKGGDLMKWAKRGILNIANLEVQFVQGDLGPRLTAAGRAALLDAREKDGMMRFPWRDPRVSRS
ncbi:hypothetical protein PINS_up016466 [Pythium insidiosum]|nr:hypothetical protein PINS_up016466 [Pythium insidiosum]